MQILDDVLTPDEVKQIEDLLVSNRFPWYVIPSLNGGYDNPNGRTPQALYDPKIVDTFQMSHVFQERGEDTKILIPLMMRIVTAAGLGAVRIHRFKANMLTQNTLAPSDHFHVPHIDASAQHMVLIYYVNESDGDTIFFKEHYNGQVIQGATVERRVTPKAGRAVVFNGMQFHASTHPHHSRLRLVLNMNFAPV